MAALDPLGSEPEYNPELDPLTYGLSIWDLDRHFYHRLAAARLRQPANRCRCARWSNSCAPPTAAKSAASTCTSSGPKKRSGCRTAWSRVPTPGPFRKTRKLRILENLLQAEEFEHFLDRRFIGQKRFSLEGAETAIAIFAELANCAAEDNVHEIVIGMAHRGRLNVLANIIGKPLGQIFSEFEGNIDPASAQGSGDVKYHLGASGVHRIALRHATLLFRCASNPSHLEAVNPVVEGVVRAKQDLLGDADRARVIPLLDPRRRRVHRPGRRGRNPQPFATRRLRHRRHHSLRHQQPDRLHHPAAGFALHPLRHRYRAHGPGAHLPRQRRRPRSLHPRSPDWPSITARSSSAM